METKIIKIRVFSAYSKSKRTWYVTRIKMTKKEFLKYIKGFKVQEFKENDSWKIKEDETYSWDKKYINELHD